MSSRFHSNPQFETLQLHAGQEVSGDPVNGARAVPIYASTSFCFHPEQSENLFGIHSNGYVYSRIANPTVTVFEKRMTALEGGVAAVATSSGMAAQFVALLSLAHSGDNIIASSFLYGGTRNQLQVTFKGFGVDVHFVTSNDPSDFSALINSRTKALYVESIGNPKFIVTPLKELAQVAHEKGIPFVVDNTFGMGGYLVRPIDHGADVVVASATKWIGGHGTTIGGIVVDAGTFNWKVHGDKFPGFNCPSPGFSNRIYTEVFERDVFAAKVRNEMMRDMGPALNPMAAFLLIQGLETLSLRAERQCENALNLAKYLEAHPKIAWVSYTGLVSHESHERSKIYLRRGLYGGVLAMGVKGLPTTFLNNLKLASHLANIGDAKTLVICPSSSTHIQSSEREKQEAGVTSDLIRVSVGIEAIVDIIADFEAALSFL